jgi:hypothetical protein
MSWWTSIVDRANTIRNGIGTGAQWVWENATLSRVTFGVITYAANTAFQILEQGLALRKAVPTLINNPEARKILNSMAHLVVHDVLPMVSLNALNNSIQTYFREGEQEDVAWYNPYTVVLIGSTLVNYAVTVYTWRQGPQTSARTFILDSFGPPAFNSNKTTPATSLCTELKCNGKRKMKGLAREPLILLGNDILTSLINKFVPYVGPTLSRVLNVFFIGRYITRLVTPERCERHKAMMQESVLALGLSYEITAMLMDMLLERTTGIPPWFYHRTLRHILLLLHINTAAHMTIPLMQPKDATMPIDPLEMYEWLTRFMADVVLAGLMKRVPIDFKPEKGAPPLIPLSPTLQSITRVLKSDLESEQLITYPGICKQAINAIHPWVLPPMLRSADNLINDPIVSKHWPALREGGISTVDFIRSIGKTKTISTLAWAPKSVATVLNMKFGISKRLTKTILMLSQERDFWDLADALKAWFERHNIKVDVKLVNKPQLALHGSKKIEPLPELIDLVPTVPALNLVPDRQRSVKSETIIKPEDLISSKKPLVTVLPSASPDSLFTTRKRGVIFKPGGTASSSEQAQKQSFDLF